MKTRISYSVFDRGYIVEQYIPQFTVEEKVTERYGFLWLKTKTYNKTKTIEGHWAGIYLTFVAGNYHHVSFKTRQEAQDALYTYLENQEDK